jgi:hypothetical protein
MIAKAALFIVAFAMCGALLVLRFPMTGEVTSQYPLLWVVGLYVLGAWCACRAYYFGFYVITAYCDPGYRYSGVLSALRWVMQRRGAGAADRPPQ